MAGARGSLRMRAAACSSASRCAPGSARERALEFGFADFQFCQACWPRADRICVVYSSNRLIAARLTSRKIAATVSSMRSSCVVLECEQAGELCARNPRRRVDSRAIPVMLGSLPPPPAKASSIGCMLRALQLQRGLVDDQPRADRHDLLDCLEIVGAQRVAAGDQIHDRVGQPDQRRQFHRTVKLDQIDVHALGRKVLARGLADTWLPPAGARPGARRPRSRSRSCTATIIRHFAIRDRAADRARPAVLEQHILAGDAQIGRAILHIGRHIGCAHDDDADFGAVGRR